jgi:hypothetical protein
MSRIWGRGNRETELALMLVLRRAKITGWRRHQKIRKQKAETVWFGRTSSFRG